MLELLREVVSRGSTDAVVRECRNCGTELSADEEGCPACGSTDVARYDID